MNSNVSNIAAVLCQLLQSAKDDTAYKNYLFVRDCVLDMLAEAQGGTDMPSNYWDEELAGFDYLFDASPLIIRKLREHCYHITGLRSYEYRQHHEHKLGLFREKLKVLQKIDANNLFIPEHRDLGGFGHEIDGELVNIDTLKFYESLIALDRAGVLERFRSLTERPIIVEIGAGWGGFAYQFKKIMPHCIYVIIDLPQTMLFSGVYLKTLFPEAKTFIYGENGNNIIPFDSITDYDFVFIPHYLTKTFQLPRIDLCVNMVSFQEMTSNQVLSYTQWLWESSCQTLYSHNRARSAHNSQLSDISQLLTLGFELEEIPVLPIPYTSFKMPQPVWWGTKLKKMAYNIIRSVWGPPQKNAGTHQDYRHLLGRPRAFFKVDT